uniref:Uncharacterized protein n=1 Tax=Panagrolaimus sp. JU765 TaxID=591449 RepID=A0AC34RFA5_9BILA
MSLMKQVNDGDSLPGSVLAVLVALLLLLAGVIWVAFCIAVHRAALRIAEIKRQRRRQHILATALNRAASQPVSSVNTRIPMQFPSENDGTNLSLNDLPTYEEALRLIEFELISCQFSRPVSRNESGVRIFANTGHLRVAPERPGTTAVSMNQEDSDPPSYEIAINTTTMESSFATP